MTCLPGILCAPRAPWLLNPGLFPEDNAGEFPPSFPSLQSHPQGILGKPPAWIHRRELWGDCGKWRSTRTRKAHTGPQNGERSLSLLLSQAHQGFRFQKNNLCVDRSTSSPTAPLYMVPSRSRAMAFLKDKWQVWKLTPPSYRFPSLFFFFFISEHCMSGLSIVFLNSISNNI